MQDIINYLLSHALELIQIATAVIAAASLVANLTPTDADNKFIAVLAKLVNGLALNFKK